MESQETQEDRKPRTVRLSDATWERVKELADIDRRKASDWLRVKIEDLVHRS